MKELLNAQIIGCGPAGLSLLVSADSHGELDQFLSSGTIFIEKNCTIGAGSLNGVQSSSNSQANEFHEAVWSQGIFHDALQQQVAKSVEGFGKEILPLPYVSAFLNEIGGVAKQVIEDHPNNGFIAHKEIPAVSVMQNGEGNIFTSLDHFGNVVARSRQIVLAPGAWERVRDAGTPERNTKLFLSHEVLSDLYSDEIGGRLAAYGGRIVILGGSHSALAVAAHSLSRFDGELNEGSVTIFHRNPIKVFYDTIPDAEEDRYYYTEADVCQRSLRVNRFSGVRGPAKELYRRVRFGEETRVILTQISDPLSMPDELDNAAIIVQALGYEARSIQFIDDLGRNVGPHMVNGRVEVDGKARILDNKGQVIEGAYAIGLGHGFRPNPKIGGEPSAANHPVDAFNFYAGPVGEIIYKQLLGKGGE